MLIRVRSNRNSPLLLQDMRKWCGYSGTQPDRSKLNVYSSNDLDNLAIMLLITYQNNQNLMFIQKSTHRFIIVEAWKHPSCSLVGE